jgi:hypothetical protein
MAVGCLLFIYFRFSIAFHVVHVVFGLLFSVLLFPFADTTSSTQCFVLSDLLLVIPIETSSRLMLKISLIYDAIRMIC